MKFKFYETAQITIATHLLHISAFQALCVVQFSCRDHDETVPLGSWQPLNLPRNRQSWIFVPSHQGVSGDSVIRVGDFDVANCLALARNIDNNQSEYVLLAPTMVPNKSRKLPQSSQFHEKTGASIAFTRSPITGRTTSNACSISSKSILTTSYASPTVAKWSSNRHCSLQSSWRLSGVCSKLYPWSWTNYCVLGTMCQIIRHRRTPLSYYSDGPAMSITVIYVD